MSVLAIWWSKFGKGTDGVWFKWTLLSFPFDCNTQWTALITLPLSLFLSPCRISSPFPFFDSFSVSSSPLSISASLFLLHLFNLNALVISIILKNTKNKKKHKKHKTQKQISKIEETNILIKKNPKQKRIKSKPIQPKKKLRVLRSVRNILSHFIKQIAY